MGGQVLANQWTSDPDDDDDDDGSGTQLPNAARQHMRKLEKENAALKVQVEEFLKSQRTSSLSDKVKAKGYDPMVAALIPPTVDGDAVDKWLDDHAKVLAKAVSDESTAEDEGTGGVSPEQMAAMQAVTNASAAGIVPIKPADLYAQMQDPKLTKEGLDAIIRSQGGKV